MTIPHDEGALFLKAKIFMNRALGSSEPRSFEEAALWASLALELLGKAALAKVNPLLIAEPLADDGRSMMYAAGLNDNRSKFRTIPAKAVFARCAAAFRPFSYKDALELAYERNAYLHSASPFTLVGTEDEWWAQFWRLASLLLQAQDRSVDDLVPYSRVDDVDRYLALNKEFLKELVEAKLGRARQRVGLLASGAVSAKVAADLTRQGMLEVFGFDFESTMDCPICGYDSADICGSGAEVENSEYDAEGILETLVVGTDWFYCRKCGLRLENYDEVEESDVVPTTFMVARVTNGYDDVEYENE